MRATTLAAAVSLGLGVGCGDLLAPEGVVGTYHLQQVDGRQLPVGPLLLGSDSLTVLGGGFVLARDSTFAGIWRFQKPDGAQIQSGVRGTYRVAGVEGDALALHLTPDDSSRALDGTVRDWVLTLQPGAWADVEVYRNIDAPDFPFPR
jgi:hypothetical protein